MAQKIHGIDETLRQAIRDADDPPYIVAKKAGIAGPMIYRFLGGSRGLSLDSAAKLCRHLGLELVPVVRPKGSTRKDGKA